MATSIYPGATTSNAGSLTRKVTRFYAPELDAMRFFAFLLVFARHVTNALGFAKRGLDTQQASLPIAQVLPAVPLPLMSWTRLQEALQSFDFGVCLFFFLSAFLITRLLLLEREAMGRVQIRQFYIRRCLRIWPLYFFFLALVVSLSHFFPVLHISMARLLVATFFIGNWAAVLHGWSSLAIQPLWSVSVEEQFYLIWPLFARRGREFMIVASTACLLLAFATLFYLGRQRGLQVTAIWPNTAVQGLFLAGGALTACLSFPETRWLRNRVRLLLLGLGGLCWVTASAGFHVVRTQSPGSLSLMVGYTLVLAGTFLIFTGIAGWSGRPIPHTLIYLGKISYGLYVFHVACLLLMQQATHAGLIYWHVQTLSPYLGEIISALLALSLTICCAALTYRYLERPFLKLKDRFAVVHSRVA